MKYVRDLKVTPTKLINYVIRHSLFSQCFKISGVIVIFKKRDMNVVLRPVFAKVFEKEFINQISLQ